MCWLQHAQLCRVSGHNEAAGTASLEALARSVPGAALERARLLWDRDQQHDAILKLKEVRCPYSASALGILPWPERKDMLCEIPGHRNAKVHGPE